MKLSQQDIKRLSEILAVANMAGIEALVFQDNGALASGLNNDQSCALITPISPNFGQKLGLGRINTFKNRLDLLLNSSDLIIDAKEHERGEISHLDMGAGKAKTSYRATATAMIKAPKEIDDPSLGTCIIKKEQWTLITGAIKSMGAKNVAIVIKGNGDVLFEAMDPSTADKFSVQVDDKIQFSEDSPGESAVHYLPTDMLTTLARAAMSEDGTLTFTIGLGGTVKLAVNGCEMSIMAQVDLEE